MEIVEEVVRFLLEKEITISFAESLTGGMLSSFITKFPGVSKIFKGSVVSYSDFAKEKVLFVPKDILEKFSAVSEETAYFMAKNVQKLFETDISISLTGYAGPDFPDGKKGLVYATIFCFENGYDFCYHLSGNRNEIRKNATLMVLNDLNKILRRLDYD